MNALTAQIDAPAHAQQAVHGNDFCRYCGIGSPGVRPLRNLRFMAKAAIVSVWFAVPLALVGYHWFVQQSDAIAFSVKERLGVDYTQAVVPLMPLAQLQRRITPRGPGADEAGLAAVKAERTTALKALEAMHSRLGAEIGTDAACKAMLAAGAAVSAPATDPDPARPSHGAYLTSVVALVTAAAQSINHQAAALAGVVANFKLPLAA